MKKIISSMLLVFALSTSVAVMAQVGSTENTQAKTETCCKDKAAACSKDMKCGKSCSKDMKSGESCTKDMKSGEACKAKSAKAGMKSSEACTKACTKDMKKEGAKM